MAAMSDEKSAVDDAAIADLAAALAERVLAPDGGGEPARLALRGALERVLAATGAVVEVDGKRWVRRSTVRQVMSGMIEALRQALDGEVADGPARPKREEAWRRIEQRTEELLPPCH
jgi:hypothetical protein